MAAKSKIFNDKWEFYIARNVPVWHNTLQLVGSDIAYDHYKISKAYIQFRIHNLLESDFYYPLTGPYAAMPFLNSLEKNLKNKIYINFLEKEYKKDGTKLLLASKKVKANGESLKSFFNLYGYCTALLDITSWASKILTENIMDELKGNHKRDSIIAFYAAPKQLAPIQKMEKDLLKLHKHNNLNKAAHKLWEKYNWIPVGFVGEPWDKDYFFNLLKKYTQKPLATKKKPEVKLSTKLKFILWSLAKVTYLNEYRKGIFCQVSLNIRPILNEISKLSHLKDWKEVSLLTHQELILAAGGKDFSDLVKKRKKEIFAVHNINSRNFQVVYGSEVKKFESKFKFKNINTDKFGGTVASKGNLIGKVKVVLNHNDFKKIKAGDILVAKMTSVDYLPIMRIAAAFITDEGGLACHAAVVSREFGVPCIIGTKIATQILKDGDKIEIDANKGIIKKI